MTRFFLSAVLLALVPQLALAQLTPAEAAEEARAEAQAARSSMNSNKAAVATPKLNAEAYNNVPDLFNDNYEELYLGTIVYYGPEEALWGDAGVFAIQEAVDNYGYGMQGAGQMYDAALYEEALGNADYNMGMYQVVIGDFAGAIESFQTATSHYQAADIDYGIAKSLYTNAIQDGIAASEGMLFFGVY